MLLTVYNVTFPTIIIYTQQELVSFANSITNNSFKMAHVRIVHCLDVPNAPVQLSVLNVTLLTTISLRQAAVLSARSTIVINVRI